jgi:hypothetical protein
MPVNSANRAQIATAAGSVHHRLTASYSGGHQRQRIAGQAEVGGVAEADEAGVADQQVEAHGEDGHDQHLDVSSCM